MKKLKLLSILFLLILSIGCENGETLYLDEKAHEELVFLQTLNENRSLYLQVDWDNPKLVEKEGTSFSEFEINAPMDSGVYKLLQVSKENFADKFFVLLFLSSSDFNSNISYIDDLGNFSGTINWLDLNGDIVALEAYEEGNRVNLTKSEDIGETNAINLKSNDCGGTVWKTDLNKEGKLEAKDECDYVYTGGGGGYYVTVKYYTWTDWYYDRGSRWDYAYRSDYKVTYAREWVSAGRDYANGTGNIGGVNVRYGNNNTNRIIRDIGTIERIWADIDDDQNPFFFVHCGSFEFYKAPGAYVTAAAVTGMSETFFAYLSNGTNDPDKREITIGVPNRLYFKLPSWRRNGEAANMTARALTVANRATEAWFLLNPRASSSSLQSKWESFIRNSMKTIGGQVSTVAPFPMLNAGIYQTSLLTSGDCK